MSKDSGKKVSLKEKGATITWGPVAAILGTIGIYFLSQFVIGFLFGLFFGFSSWSQEKIDDWAQSTVGQFLLIGTSGLATMGLLWLFLRRLRAGFKVLGFSRRPQWNDALFTAAGFFVYFVLLITATVIASQFFGVNADQEQDIGFEQVKAGSGGLALVFLSLVVIPPVVEEIMFRGFLFGGLRGRLSFWWTTAIVSVLFAAPHLFGGFSGLLWIAAIDTFVLSLVLCYVREKTGALWASIGIHAVKNSLAFIAIFVIQ
jgi:membrane protease YdiL (CAAX protease family)